MCVYPRIASRTCWHMERQGRNDKHLEIWFLVAVDVIVDILLDVFDLVGAEIVVVEEAEHELQALHVIVVALSIRVQLLLTLSLALGRLLLF